MKKDDSLTIRINSDLKEKLAALADAEKRTLSQYVSILLQDFVSQIEAPDQDDLFEKKVNEIKRRARNFNNK